MKGAIAAGHPATAEAGRRMFELGGNAFDAATAALAAACVAEPVLTSLGGGGFLTAHPAGEDPRVYDFFVQTPRKRRPHGEIDFYPIVADFGTTHQEFHIGMGSMATPGTVDGLVTIQQDLGRLPLAEVLGPAIEYADGGIRINALQAYIFSVVEPIYLATPGARRIYGSPGGEEALHGEGTLFRQPELADSLRLVATEGSRPFYHGQAAARLVADNRENGGHLRADDLAAYRTQVRAPLRSAYRGWAVSTNPLPSSGGTLIAFAQQLLETTRLDATTFGSADHLDLLADVMDLTNRARVNRGVDTDLLDPELLARYRRMLDRHPLASRGTTHISVVDRQGNAAALTLSNGEGSGYVLPGTGIMLNNMLGEEDLNPGGFGRWQEDVRVSSMMAPTIATHADRLIATGSGGSNRLRTAILQTLVNLVDFGMDPQAAVFAPRIHYERGQLHLEPGFAADVLDHLRVRYPQLTCWEEINLFFGGTHTVMRDGEHFSGCGDPRRGGIFIVQP